MEPKFPKGEIVWTGHYDQNGVLRYIITSKSARDTYFLYEAADGKFIRLGKDKNPQVLEKKYIKL